MSARAGNVRHRGHPLRHFCSADEASRGIGVCAQRDAGAPGVGREASGGSHMGGEVNMNMGGGSHEGVDPYRPVLAPHDTCTAAAAAAAAAVEVRLSTRSVFLHSVAVQCADADDLVHFERGSCVARDSRQCPHHPTGTGPRAVGLAQPADASRQEPIVNRGAALVLRSPALTQLRLPFIRRR